MIPIRPHRAWRASRPPGSMPSPSRRILPRRWGLYLCVAFLALLGWLFVSRVLPAALKYERARQTQGGNL